jgi:hypothetical protein
METITPIETFGEFNDAKPRHGEYLNIGFSPSYGPLKKRWETNGVSADFIAEYFRNFHVGNQEINGTVLNDIEVENIRDAVKYIANELLENAMKFQEAGEAYMAQIYLFLFVDKVAFRVTNAITPQQQLKLKTFIQQVLTEDPHEIYFQVMRNSALEENSAQSGLGLLSMICDYGARLGWQFGTLKPKHDGDELMIVTTMVTLNT